MSVPVHIAIGMLIGKLTGNYGASLLAATAIDLDHGISYIREGILFRPKELLKVIMTEKDPWSNQRNLFHNIFFWALISAISFIWGKATGLAVTFGYLSHLLLDALDTADYYPLYPSKIINLKGPVTYFSRHEGWVIGAIAGVYFFL